MALYTFDYFPKKVNQIEINNMAIVSKSNSHARIMLYAAIAVMVGNRRRQLFKKKSRLKGIGGEVYFAIENFTVTTIMFIKT